MFNMFNAPVPQDVLDLVNEYKQHKNERDLIITGGMLFLYKLTIEKGKEGQPDIVRRGEFIKRAAWQEASNMSFDMLKARLGL